MAKKVGFHENFLRTLGNLTTSGNQMIANVRLREALRWPEERYTRIKNELRTEGSVIVAQGSPGGLVGLSGSGSRSLSLFISYSHFDQEMEKALVKHLQPLKRANLISEWHDVMISPGDEWDRKIMSELEKADIVILLVSIDFINSEYCASEMDRALAREARGEAKIIPIIVRDCLWSPGPFDKLQAIVLPGNKSVESWPNKDEALTLVIREIRRVASDMQAGA